MAHESWKVEEEGAAAAGCQLPEGPVLCTNNCGFFGSVATMNLCSKCYRDKQQQHQSVKAAAAAAAPPPPATAIDISSIKAMATATTTTTATNTNTITITDDNPGGEEFLLGSDNSSAQLHLQLGQDQQGGGEEIEEVMIATRRAKDDFSAVVGDGGGGSGEDVAAAAAAGGASQEEERPPSPPPPPSRCFSCRKRVGLTGFKCRCGDVFCAMHRYSDKHSCSFDYKAAGREAIAKANPVVKADKIGKI